MIIKRERVDKKRLSANHAQIAPAEGLGNQAVVRSTKRLRLSPQRSIRLASGEQ